MKTWNSAVIIYILAQKNWSFVEGYNYNDNDKC